MSNLKYYGKLTVYWNKNNSNMKDINNYLSIGLEKLYTKDKEKWGDCGKVEVIAAVAFPISDDYYDYSIKMDLQCDKPIIDYCMNLSDDKNVTTIYRYYNSDDKIAGYAFSDLKKKSKVTAEFYDSTIEEYQDILKKLNIEEEEEEENITISINDLRKGNKN